MQHQQFHEPTLPALHLAPNRARHLFERGFITVERGVVRTHAKPHDPAQLREFLKRLDGRRYGRWSEGCRPYFAWHARYRRTDSAEE